MVFLLVCQSNGQTKPWNLWACSSTANNDNSKPFTEALNRSKNVFSASEKGRKSFILAWISSPSGDQSGNLPVYQLPDPALG